MINILEYVTTGMGDGGAETLIKDYALLLDKSKYNVIIVTIGPLKIDSANYRRLIDANIKIISIYEHPKVFRSWVIQKIWNRCFHKRYVSRKLLHIIRKYNIDVLHAHLEVLYSLVPISRKLKGIKLLWTCHNQPNIIFKPTKWESEEKSARYLIKHNNMQMIALHEEMKEEINKRFSVNNTTVIHNGINFECFRNVSESISEIRNSILIPNEAYVVGHVGRFTEAKNHLFLVDIFCEVLKQRPNAHLLMVGAGDLREATESKLQNLGLNGKYTILSHRTDIPRLLKAMDVFVFPSKFEGLPVSMVEAQVAGLKTVASKNITWECFFLRNAIPLSIEDSPITWANTILDENASSGCHNDIELFDMSKEIIRLGQLYEKD